MVRPPGILAGGAGAGMDTLPLRRGAVHSRTRRIARAGSSWALLAAVTLALGGGLIVQAAVSAQSWRIDEQRTAIGFKIEAVGFPTTRGRFTRYEGRILLDFDHPAKSVTSFTVDSGSVELGSKSFDDFVKSAALLDVTRFPTLSFASTQVEKLDPRTARVTGNLTMLGVTKPIALTVKVETEPSGKRRIVAFAATGTLKRSDYGMIFGIPLIDDALEITVKTRALSDE
jgi:polyisoprenoid-binding protein YceI